MKPTPTVCLTLLAAVGCGGDPGPSVADPKTERPDPSAYESEIGSELKASLTPDEAAALAPQMMKLATKIDPSSIFSAYVGVAVGADADCPTTQQLIDTPQEQGGYWEADDCVSQAGTRFKGAVRLVVFSRIDADGNTEDGFELFAETFEIEASDGTYLRGVAQLFKTEYVSLNGNVEHSLFYRGRLEADAATRAGKPWLDGTLDGALNLYAGDYNGDRAIHFNGTIRLPAGGPVSAVDMSELGVNSYACPDLSAGGEMSLRGVAGGWHDASFGVENDPNTCDACGDLTFASTPLGKFCSDQTEMNDLLSWGTTPW